MRLGLLCCVSSGETALVDRKLDLDGSEYNEIKGMGWRAQGLISVNLRFRFVSFSGGKCGKSRGLYVGVLHARLASGTVDLLMSLILSGRPGLGLRGWNALMGRSWGPLHLLDVSGHRRFQSITSPRLKPHDPRPPSSALSFHAPFQAPPPPPLLQSLT